MIKCHSKILLSWLSLGLWSRLLYGFVFVIVLVSNLIVCVKMICFSFMFHCRCMLQEVTPYTFFLNLWWLFDFWWRKWRRLQSFYYFFRIKIIFFVFLVNSKLSCCFWIRCSFGKKSPPIYKYLHFFFLIFYSYIL